MRGSEVIKGISNKEIKNKVNKLSRKSFYFIKGYKIDDIPLQFTHFYRWHLRFKILAWPDVPDIHFIHSGVKSIEQIIKASRVKLGGLPMLPFRPNMSRSEKIKTNIENSMRIKSQKGYINLSYSTLAECDHITFVEIDYEDLPMYIGGQQSWTHLKGILGVNNN